MKPLLLTLPGNAELGERLAQCTGWECGAVAARSFPDGETHLRIDADCTGRSVAVLCALDRPNEKALPLLFAASTVRELGAARVGVVAPYLAYMRQDRRFQAGEAVTSRIFARLLSQAFDWLVTLDPHLHRFHALGELYSIPTRVAHAAPALASWIAAEVAAPLLVGPDQESEQWVAEVARRIGAPHLVLAKTRRGDRDVEISVPDVDHYRDRSPVILDDVVSSARTMIETVRRLRAAGLADPVCLGIHGIFAGDTQRALREAGAARIVTTTSIRHETNAIEIAELLVSPVSELVLGPVTRPGVES